MREFLPVPPTTLPSGCVVHSSLAVPEATKGVLRMDVNLESDLELSILLVHSMQIDAFAAQYHLVVVHCPQAGRRGTRRQCLHRLMSYLEASKAQRCPALQQGNIREPLQICCQNDGIAVRLETQGQSKQLLW